MGCRAPRDNRLPNASLSVRLLSGGTLLGLVYEHDRDSVADRIAPSARITNKPIFHESNRRLADRACEDVQQLLIDHSEDSSLGLTAVNWLLRTWRIIVTPISGQQVVRADCRDPGLRSLGTFGLDQEYRPLSRRRHTTPSRSFNVRGGAEEGDGAGLHDAA